MKREAELQARLHGLTTLGQAVGAMKSLSAHHLRTAREALEPVRVYRDELQRLLASTGASLPAGDGGTGLLVIGAEMGLCGAYNVRVAAAAAATRREHGPGPTFCVGSRVANHLRRHGEQVVRSYAGPTGVRGTTELLLRLAQDIIDDYIALKLRRFVVVASGFRGVGTFEPGTTDLLPVVAGAAPGAPPVRYASRDHLAAVAVREVLYVTMVGVLLEALASEHGARLFATQAAERWLDDHIEHLRRRLSAARREASTQEVVELSTGARVRGVGV